MSAASRNDMAGLQKLQDSLVEKIGEDGKRGHRGRFIREMLTAMHAQGVVLEDAASQLGINANNASVYACRMGLTFKTDAQRRREWRQAVIRQGYADNRPLPEIAAEIGSTVESVKVLACRMGVTRSCADAAAYRRGFSVPEHLKEDYRVLKQRGKYRARDAGIALGLLEA